MAWLGDGKVRAGRETGCDVMMDDRVLTMRFSEVRLISDGDKIDAVSNFLIEPGAFVCSAVLVLLCTQYVRYVVEVVQCC